jgi:hypothetical protein
MELLGLVWATKYFRCYLYGRKFLARTDHAADNNNRLMIWSLRLSEFDFSLEHTSGSKLTHVDALSRHVATIGDRTVLTRQLIRKEQCQDSFCDRQKQTRLTAKSEFFSGHGRTFV